MSERYERTSFFSDFSFFLLLLGYGGPDCSYRLCPKGVDPFLSHDALPVIRLLTSVYSIYHAPTYVAVINDFSFSFQPNTWTTAQCKTAFESLRNFGTVNCTKTILSNFETEFLITITSFPTLNYETNYLENNGDPSSLSFDCYDITTDVTLDVNRCQMTAVSSTGTYPSKLLTLVRSLLYSLFFFILSKVIHFVQIVEYVIFHLVYVYVFVVLQDQIVIILLILLFLFLLFFRMMCCY
jgi:hypothetical protein